jgi:hypothetical protein
LKFITFAVNSIKIVGCGSWSFLLLECLWLLLFMDLISSSKFSNNFIFCILKKIMMVVYYEINYKKSVFVKVKESWVVSWIKIRGVMSRVKFWKNALIERNHLCRYRIGQRTRLPLEVSVLHRILLCFCGISFSTL